MATTDEELYQYGKEDGAADASSRAYQRAPVVPLDKEDPDAYERGYIEGYKEKSK